MIEQWTDERLNQFASTTEVGIRENTQRFAELAEALLRLSEAQTQTNQNLNVVIDRMDRMQSEIREMQSEVRGLQTENRRILDRLFPE